MRFSSTSARRDAVDEVADGTGNERDSTVAQHGRLAAQTRIKERREHEQQRSCRDEEHALMRKDAECRAGIQHVGDVEDVRDDGKRFAGQERHADERLDELVEREDAEKEDDGHHA